MYAYIINSVVRCTSLCFDKICNSSRHWIVKFFQDIWCYTILWVTYSLQNLFSFTWHLATNHFLYYIPNVLCGIHGWRIPRPFRSRYTLTFYECSSTFIIMAWREIMHTNIALLLEHSAITCHFNIMNNITLAFYIIHVTIHFSHSYLLLLIVPYWRFNSGLNILSMMFLSLFPQTQQWRLLLWLRNTDSCAWVVFPKRLYFYAWSRAML